MEPKYALQTSTPLNVSSLDIEENLLGHDNLVWAIVHAGVGGT